LSSGSLYSAPLIVLFAGVSKVGMVRLAAGEEMEDFSSGGPFHQTHVAQSFFSDLFRDGSGTMTVSSNIYALSMR